jgi:uncharacterized membrane protein YkoI
MNRIRFGIAVTVAFFLAGQNLSASVLRSTPMSPAEKMAMAKSIFSQNPIELETAIGLAQAKVPSGFPIAAGGAMSQGKGSYTVAVSTGRVIKLVMVDSNTGKIQGITEKPAGQGIQGNPRVGAWRLTLIQAIKIAKQAVQGKPFDSEFKVVDGRDSIEVELYHGGAATIILIDAVTGEICRIIQK